MLTDVKLKSLKPAEKAYKVADRDAMYVVVAPTGGITFRLDYRINGRRETLTLGRYGPEGLSLAEARGKAVEARRLAAEGVSPSAERRRAKRKAREAKTFGDAASAWLQGYRMADSTRAMRQSVLERDVLPKFGRRKLEEITDADVRDLCDAVLKRGAPATAVHARDVVNQVYRWVIERGQRVKNPAEIVRPSSIATFLPKDRALSEKEVGIFLLVLEEVSTLPTIRLALRLLLLTLVRKGELLAATWDEVDFMKAVWTIPKERMKARRPHNVYLSQQALDILVALKTCAGGSSYLLPSRYDVDKPISNATLNRVIDVAVDRAIERALPLERFTVHDLRRTASTLLHEAGFNSDWIEKCLAHEQRGVRAVYNRAEYADQRRDMLQQWADMVDSWVVARSKSEPCARAK
ncbi:tyrosine-type recombinase/integrase [Aromatoleum buckelii]|uniref:Tyrosine-type recombinase/integrase n=1 Tax=Aromatoleum buckelii TaxID=200254 RepID=A0ABX1N3P7_9RHOO|nr:site-specific integrase [Aromatoleum buckelii]MCK0509837.1 tyrosine-type recombinase/integrase [Aromatoleum buckelii]